jgi:hypothetical protein
MLCRFLLIPTGLSHHVPIANCNKCETVSAPLMTCQQYMGYCAGAPRDNGRHTLTTSHVSALAATIRFSAAGPAA